MRYKIFNTEDNNTITADDILVFDRDEVDDAFGRTVYISDGDVKRKIINGIEVRYNPDVSNISKLQWVWVIIPETHLAFNFDLWYWNLDARGIRIHSYAIQRIAFQMIFNKDNL